MIKYQDNVSHSYSKFYVKDPISRMLHVLGDDVQMNLTQHIKSNEERSKMFHIAIKTRRENWHVETLPIILSTTSS